MPQGQQEAMTIPVTDVYDLPALSEVLDKPLPAVIGLMKSPGFPDSYSNSIM